MEEIINPSALYTVHNLIRVTTMTENTATKLSFSTNLNAINYG